MKRLLVMSLVAFSLAIVSVNEANARWRLRPRFWGSSCGPAGCMPAVPAKPKPAPPVAPAPAPAVWLRSADQPPVAPVK